MSPTTVIQGCLGLVRLGCATRFKLSSDYWQWRTKTAFPGGTPEGGRRELIRSAIEYGAWSWRSRRL